MFGHGCKSKRSTGGHSQGAVVEIWLSFIDSDDSAIVGSVGISCSDETQ